MNIIGKLKLSSAVPTPPTGYGAIFVDSTDNAPKIKLADGSISTLRGPTGATGPAGAITSVSSIALAAGATPTVTNTGTSTAAQLVFGLPVASLVRKTTSVAFTDGETIQRLTVTDALVTPTNPPAGLNILVGAASESVDYQYNYDVVLSSVGTGSFIVLINVADGDGDSVAGLPLPTVTLNYLI